ncbi:amino acid ABC transporter substrate-binding protein [Rhodovibrionaceae bacterium A322]
MIRKICGVLAVVLAATGATTAVAGTLDRIKTDGKIVLGVRDDAAPFSFKNDLGEYAGYTVNLCKAVALGLKSDLNLSELTIEYKAVTPSSRFDAIASGEIDLLCGATTASLSRRELVDFSVPTFVTGASVVFRAGGPSSFTELTGNKIGVRGGTSTQEGLELLLKTLDISATVVPLDSHSTAMAQLKKGEISAYFGDRAILGYLVLQQGADAGLVLSKRYFSYEPYALALQRGDDDFRLSVDRAVSRLFRSPNIGRIFSASFGPAAKPSELMAALYIIGALPE